MPQVAHISWWPPPLLSCLLTYKACCPDFTHDVVTWPWSCSLRPQIPTPTPPASSGSSASGNLDQLDLCLLSAPEMVKGDPIGSATDIWGAGVLTYIM